MQQIYARIIVAAAPVRRKPRHKSEMVNQLLYGEEVEILRERDERWMKIRSLHDQYEGWITRHLLEEIEPGSLNPGTPCLFSGLFNPFSAAGHTLVLPFGAVFHGDAQHSSFHVINRKERPASFETLRELALPWLHVPYLWGGRTPMGIDCSGLVQVLYRAMGIDLPRDAWQQAQEGSPVKKFRDARPGDLLFFDAGEEIVHVGILMNDHQMIHASGIVRLDAVDKKGIVYEKKIQRRLKLRAIRRIF